MFKYTWKLYEFICRNPMISIRELHEKIGWRTNRIRKHVRKLRKEELIKWKYICDGNSQEWLLYPTSLKELVDRDKMKFK